MYSFKRGLTWDDWKYASEHKLALRHLTDTETASTEQKNGGSGDAFSLVLQGYHRKASLKVNIKLITEALGKRLSELADADTMASSKGEMRNKNVKSQIKFYSSKLKEEGLSETQAQECIVAIYNILLYESLANCHTSFAKEAVHHYLVIAHPNANMPFAFSTNETVTIKSNMNGVVTSISALPNCI